MYSPDVSLDFVSGNIRTPNCFPRDHTLNAYWSQVKILEVKINLSTKDD